jgi:hypothetical protein
VASGAESDTAPASSSSNAATQKVMKKDIPTLQDCWKKSMVTEADRAASHAAGWLLGGVVSTIFALEFPMVDNTTIVCFESHLIAGLGLPPSKFLICILNILRCELVHLNPNAIIVLSYFTMLCECWLGIAPNTSLFLYFYGLARYASKSSPGSGYHCAATTGMSTWRPHSRAAGKAPPKSSSSLIQILNLNG